MQNRFRVVCPLVLTLCAVGLPSSAASITSAWYYGVSTYGGASPQITNNSGPANVARQELNQSGPRICPGCPTTPGFYYDQNSDALLSGNATTDMLHGFVQSADTVTWGPQAGPGNGTLSSFANFGFTAADAIHFTSNTLASGTPVTFLLTENLDSLITATSPGTCIAGGGHIYAPNGQASLQLFGPNSVPLLGQLVHDSCGLGSNVMTLSGTFQSTVGGAFGVTAHFLLESAAATGFAQVGTYQTTVDATNTGSITIQVITPNAGFFSDSGAAFTGVPEPSTWVLAASAGLLLPLRFRKRRRITE